MVAQVVCSRFLEVHSKPKNCEPFRSLLLRIYNQCYENNVRELSTLQKAEVPGDEMYFEKNGDSVALLCRFSDDPEKEGPVLPRYPLYAFCDPEPGDDEDHDEQCRSGNNDCAFATKVVQKVLQHNVVLTSMLHV